MKITSKFKIKILELKKSQLVDILKKFKKTKIDFVDLYILSVAKQQKINIASFDKKLLKQP